MVDRECVIEPKEATGSLCVNKLAVVGPRFSVLLSFFQVYSVLFRAVSVIA